MVDKNSVTDVRDEIKDYPKKDYPKKDYPKKDYPNSDYNSDLVYPGMSPNMELILLFYLAKLFGFHRSKYKTR